MYKIKSGYIYYMSDKLKKMYILNCKTREVFEIDKIGTNLIKELLSSKEYKRSQEIISLFPEVDLFEKRSN